MGRSWGEGVYTRSYSHGGRSALESTAERVSTQRVGLCLRAPPPPQPPGLCPGRCHHPGLCSPAARSTGQSSSCRVSSIWPARVQWASGPGPGESPGRRNLHFLCSKYLFSLDHRYGHQAPPLRGARYRRRLEEGGRREACLSRPTCVSGVSCENSASPRETPRKVSGSPLQDDPAPAGPPCPHRLRCARQCQPVAGALPVKGPRRGCSGPQHPALLVPRHRCPALARKPVNAD